RFENYYASDAPCLPSRSALFSGQFGIHTGVVNHGGTAADPFIQGKSRGFKTDAYHTSWMSLLRKAGFHTVSVSPFAERHSAWWFCSGFNEMINTGRSGLERAHEITPAALDWISRNGEKDNWFLQINFWDPHTPYTTPTEYGNPFANDPPPSWHTEEILKKNWDGYGPHSAREPISWGGEKAPHPRVPTEIRTMEDYRRWIDGYDLGIHYMDSHIGRILDLLNEKRVLDDTVIIVSSDHGENQGELNIYGDHHTADHITSRVPLIIRWPGMKSNIVDKGLHYNLDLPPTLAEMLKVPAPEVWDGQSFAETITSGQSAGREFLVVSQCAWSCQRSVRFGPWIMIRSYHDGLKDFPPIMLFNVDEDPHETCNLAESYPEVVNKALALLHEWTADMMKSSSQEVDPLWTVIREGGPLHTRGYLKSYCERLRATGRAHHAEALLSRHRENN
ncbi:MAG TPA: sulfatase, partial [bacterium]|nr:sulfatase [bacterium]